MYVSLERKSRQYLRCDSRLWYPYQVFRALLNCYLFTYLLTYLLTVLKTNGAVEKTPNVSFLGHGGS